MSDSALKLAQFLIFVSVLFGSIWVGQATNYELNPVFFAAWPFMAAYGFTLLHYRLVLWRDRRRALRAGPAQQSERDRKIADLIAFARSEVAKEVSGSRVGDQYADLFDIPPKLPPFNGFKGLPGPR